MLCYPNMKRADIEHLARLARIWLTEEEKNELPDQLSSIVAYVGVVSEIAGANIDVVPQVGVHHNVFRKDEVTNEPDQYTKDILAEMPNTQGRFLSVKKILHVED